MFIHHKRFPDSHVNLSADKYKVSTPNAIIVGKYSLNNQVLIVIKRKKNSCRQCLIDIQITRTWRTVHSKHLNACKNRKKIKIQRERYFLHRKANKIKITSSLLFSNVNRKYRDKWLVKHRVAHFCFRLKKCSSLN